MSDFPTVLTTAVDGVTEIVAKHLNNVEAKIGVDASTVVTSLDYLVKSPNSFDPGHTHSAISGGTSYALLQDVKAATTDGGTFTTGAWQTRTLNTEQVNENSIVTSLSSNQFTLSAGTYRISVSAPCYGVGHHKAKLRNITDASDTLIGLSAYAGYDSIAIVLGEFTILGAKTYEIQHYCGTTQATIGFGWASSFSVSEIYTQVEIWKIA